MYGKSFHTRFFTLATLFCLALSHFYGAWHGVAHYKHTALAFQAIDVQAHASEPGGQEHVASDDEHSCVIVDALCAGKSLVSVGSFESTEDPTTYFLTVKLLLPRGHNKWTHAVARAPPRIDVV